jgi:hypothetical protein
MFPTTPTAADSPRSPGSGAYLETLITLGAGLILAAAIRYAIDHRERLAHALTYTGVALSFVGNHYTQIASVFAVLTGAGTSLWNAWVNERRLALDKARTGVGLDQAVTRPE